MTGRICFSPAINLELPSTHCKGSYFSKLEWADIQLWIPPCSRYEGGESNVRLIKVWVYVAGLIGGDIKAKYLSQKIARLYDYKGTLVVATHRNLSKKVEALFRKAWLEVGCEFEDNVEFCGVRDDRWKLLWDCRRFESDWQSEEAVLRANH